LRDEASELLSSNAAVYVYAVSRLAKYHHKSPDQLSKEDIRAFLVHLTVERKLSENQAAQCFQSGYPSATKKMLANAIRFVVGVIPAGDSI
jgi:Phage integrase, N-terminal SAM-like domain